MNKLEPWYEPSDVVLEKVNFKCEMSREDHGFLCGAIKKVKPKKIVEIGVAEGGTTGVIMNALKMLNYPAEFYSVDLCEKYYRDNNLPTGYETERIKSVIGYEGHHKFFTGKNYCRVCRCDRKRY